MRFEKFTMKSREAVMDAGKLATSLSHQQVECAHLLLTLLQQEEGVVRPLLQKIGVVPEQLAKTLDGELRKFPKVSGSGFGDPYMSRDIKALFERAMREAEEMKD
ncbi:MAG: type VI secretion system ATPase TssH, partial [Myxococcales bacterium]|nr:type VI secretion system ATPase TssH [Myxococcales bacterium]